MKFSSKIFPIPLAVVMSTLVLLFFWESLYQAKAQKPQPLPTPLKHSDFGWKPPYLFPGNKNLPKSSFVTQEEFLKTKYKDAVFKSFELMTYREYTKKFPDSGIMYDISPDRMIAVTIVAFPKGLEASNADYCHATVITYRDAQTRQVFGYSIAGKKKLNKGPGADFENGSRASSNCPRATRLTIPLLGYLWP